MALSGAIDVMFDKAFVHDTGSEKSTDVGCDASSQSSEPDDQAVNRARLHDKDVNHVGECICEALLDDDDNDNDDCKDNGNWVSEARLDDQDVNHVGEYLCEALLDDDEDDFDDVNGASEALLPNHVGSQQDINHVGEYLCEALLDDDEDGFNDVNGASEAIKAALGLPIAALKNENDVNELSGAPPLPLRLINPELGNESDSQEDDLDQAKTQLKAEFLERIGFSSLNELDSDGKSVLQIAAKEGNTEVTRALLDDEDFKLVNAKDKNLPRWTALHEAANNNRVHVVQMLMDSERFSQTNTPDRNGRNCLHIAAAMGHLEVVKAILNHPRFASIGIKDYHGFTPQKRALVHGQEAIAEYIQARIPSKGPPQLGLTYMRSKAPTTGVVVSL